MQRGAGHAQSAPQLPPTNANTGIVTQRARDRKLASNVSTVALSSADTLVTAQETTLDQPLHFEITDLLVSKQSQPQQHPHARLARKRAKRVVGESLTSQVISEIHEKPGLVPLSPIQHGSEAYHSNNKASRLSAAPGQQTYLRSLDQPENTELFTYASALCHRITGRYLSKEQLRSDPDAQTNEIARIQRDPELLQAISTIKTLSKEFKEVAHATLGHRKELGHALLRIEESYLKLFEKLLELSLRMYWKYEQDHDAERRADKKAIAYWQEMHNWKAGEATKLQKLLDGKEIVMRTQQIELRDLERQCTELRKEVGDQRVLQQQVFELQAIERDLRERERTLKADYEALKKKHEEMVLYERARLEEAHEQHRLWMDEMRHTLREREQEITRHTKAIHDLKVLTTPVSTGEASTQTMVDDDGLWDTQDGMPQFVSKDLRHRLAWRRFHAYANCKNCRGRPIKQPRAAVVARDAGSAEADDAYVDVWSLTRSERITKKAAKRIERIEAEWCLPTAIVLFLSNLPKTVVAFPFYTLDQIVDQIERIYDDKFESDKADEADGVAREELPSFICEYFLKTHGLRQSAEIGLYRFLISVKNAYRTHSHVHLFARFCHLLSSEALTSTGDVGTVVPTAAGTLMAMLVDKPRRGALDRSFLRVFLHARYILLRSPPPKVTKKGSLVPPHQPHVVQADSVRKWVPLDHAVAVTRWYVNFLPEDAVIAFCREVEYSTAIYAGRAITEISGNRLAVRAEMRKAMLANTVSDHDGERTNGDDDRRHKPQIVADVHKVLLLLMHALEQRRDVMEKALVSMFEAGDVNHDCVLSLDEFKAIVRGRAASFSDRRLLRMFREALMGSADQSFALSMDAFVKVCNDHGLVALLPDDRWEDPFQKAFETAAAVTAALARGVGRKASSAMNIAKPNAMGVASVVEELEEIPEEPALRDTASSSLSPRAEEVEDEDGLWEW